MVEKVTREREVACSNSAGRVWQNNAAICDLRWGQPAHLKTFCYIFQGFFCCLYIDLAVCQSTIRQRQNQLCRHTFIVCRLPCVTYGKAVAVSQKGFAVKAAVSRSDPTNSKANSRIHLNCCNRLRFV